MFVGDTVIIFLHASPGIVMCRPIEAYGVWLVKRGRVFAYSDDTATTDGLFPTLENADLALIEASALCTTTATAPFT